MDSGAPAVDGLNHRAQVLLERRLKEALARLEEALHMDSENYSALLMAARIYWNLGPFDEFERVALAVSNLHPDRPGTHMLLGMVATHHRRHEEALASYTHAIELSPAPTGGQYAYQAWALYYLQQYDEAERAAGRAISGPTPHYMAFVVMAWIALHRTQRDVAETWCRQGLRLEPENWMLLSTLGQVLLSRGHVKKARALVAKALYIHPENERLQRLLADMPTHARRKLRTRIARRRRSRKTRPDAP